MVAHLVWHQHSYKAVRTTLLDAARRGAESPGLRDAHGRVQRLPRAAPMTEYADVGLARLACDAETEDPNAFARDLAGLFYRACQQH